MDQTQVIINNNFVNVHALFYISNNNYYMVYTDGATDENDFVVLHIAKILQEVVNTQNGPQPTGYLIATTISNDEEYDLVKKDIASIIESKQNNVDSQVQFIEQSILGQIKVRDTKIFRLKKNIFDQIFGNITNDTDNLNNEIVNNVDNNDSVINNDQTSVLDKNKTIISQIDSIIKQLNDIKNTLM